jgi:hypothetical protein
MVVARPCERSTKKIEPKNRFKPSLTFHRTPAERKLDNAVRVQCEIEKYESFDPVTEEQ